MDGSGIARALALAALAMALVSSVALAHQHMHRASTPAVAPARAPSDSAPRPALALPESARAKAEGEEVPDTARFVMPGMREALAEHLHNKIVHFPIALSLGALLLLFLARGRADFSAAARTLVILAALAAVAAYFTGRVQEEAFEDTGMRWLAERHEKWGTATGIAIVLWAATAAWPRSRRFMLLLGIVVAALVLITAYYGGVLAHAE